MTRDSYIKGVRLSYSRREDARVKVFGIGFNNPLFHALFHLTSRRAVKKPVTNATSSEISFLTPIIVFQHSDARSRKNLIRASPNVFVFLRKFPRAFKFSSGFAYVGRLIRKMLSKRAKFNLSISTITEYHRKFLKQVQLV